MNKSTFTPDFIFMGLKQFLIGPLLYEIPLLLECANSNNKAFTSKT
ncbi:MAG: hypothetical protein ACJA1M_000748 [Alphaproteobacteria bacterium]|jgi:hypothetical protein